MYGPFPPWRIPRGTPPELSAPIVTEIQAAFKFTKAGEYHQQYVEKGGFAACHLRRKLS